MTTTARLPAEGEIITARLPGGSRIRMPVPSRAVFDALGRARDAARAGQAPAPRDLAVIAAWAGADDGTEILP